MEKETFSFQSKKRQEILTRIFFALLFIGILIWIGTLKPQLFSFLFPKVSVSYLEEPQKLKINLKLLENPKLQQLTPFFLIEKAKPEEIGNKNPFSMTLR